MKAESQDRGRRGQPLYCATPEQTALSHRLFTASLQSQASRSTIRL